MRQGYHTYIVNLDVDVKVSGDVTKVNDSSAFATSPFICKSCDLFPVLII